MFSKEHILGVTEQWLKARSQNRGTAELFKAHIDLPRRSYEKKDKMNVRFCERRTWFDKWEMKERMTMHLEKIGLGGFAWLPHFEADRSPIAALVDRWRPETNTFHFCSGEAMFTMEDVYYIYGLPILGRPLATEENKDYRCICSRLLGKVPEAHYLGGNSVLVTWLRTSFMVLPKSPSEDVQDQHLRAFILHLLGVKLAANTTFGKVLLSYLSLLDDFDTIAWNPACLAHLYRTLYKASR